MIGKRIIFCLLLFYFLFIGCSKEQKSLKPESESSSVEQTLPQIPKLAGPYKPTNKDIQIALQNAGFYEGKIDGIIGSQTRKAIEEFQAENNLAVDGEVGPKTWAILSQYLLSPKQE